MNDPSPESVLARDLLEEAIRHLMTARGLDEGRAVDALCHLAREGGSTVAEAAAHVLTDPREAGHIRP